MKKSKLDSPPSAASVNKRRSLQILLAVAFAYLLFTLSQFPSMSISPTAGSSAAGDHLRSPQDSDFRPASKRPYHLVHTSRSLASSPASLRRSLYVSGLKFADYEDYVIKRNFSELHRSAKEAWDLGLKLLKEINNSSLSAATANEVGYNEKDEEACPPHVMLTGGEFTAKGKVMMIPCGLTLGSHITLVATPFPAHPEYNPKIAILEGEGSVMVSQFMMELQGLKAVEGEEAPKILHFNPRLKGDWSGRPVIEQNTCYRMQWHTALRCEGWRSRADEETVDGQVKCEKWIRDDDNHSEESKTTWWLNRLIGKTKKVSFDWPYPFVEDKLFVLTLYAGLEGYHVHVDGRHITSFPYRTGFILEDATGLSLNGDLEVHSIYAVSLPTSHPTYAPQRSLEMLAEWQSPPLPDGPIELFIGILSAGNHFAERMAVRKSWMSIVRGSSNMVARFFVALHGRKEVNVELKKEADFFGDIVIVPYMDSYDLVVLKTLAILEYGIHRIHAKYIMKCDDDTFVRVDPIMKEVKKVPSHASLYIGNINYYHKPLRTGKWAVSYEEWPEEEYPHYANGPGYVVSADIARFVVSEFENRRLRLFKMEDVSMGMWVEQFNSSKPVEYVHSLRFCQYGCIDDYLTAHYQSPRQMICLWEKLQDGRPQCCNDKR